MKFCPDCGTRLKFKQLKSENKVASALVCEKCGFQTKAERAIAKPEETSLNSIKVVGEKESKLTTMPTADIECPKCGATGAVWWMVQTRGGDEATTQFFRCRNEACKWTWRSYL